MTAPCSDWVRYMMTVGYKSLLLFYILF